tara:strand:- start:11972 stop:13135 length:1164 start_codon:yes stop_codon:yes gene_type:complete
VKLLRVVLTFALVLAGIAAAIWFATRPALPKVTVYAVATGTVEATIANTRAGTVHAERRAKLAPAIGGQVSKLHVREGDRVEQGQVLMELWNLDLQAQLELAQRQVEQSQASAAAAKLRADLAEREAVRLRKLQQQEIASTEKVDKATSGADAAHADQIAAETQAKVSEANVGTIRAALERTIVVAPFAGVVAEVNGEIGEFVTPSPVGIPTPPAVDLIDDTALYVSAPIDEVDTARVRVGMSVKVTLDAFGKRVFAGRVRRVAPYVLDREKQARTADVEVDLVDLPDDVHLLAGYSADVEILLQAKENVLRVPAEAVRDGNKVLVVTTDGDLTERTIEKGLVNWRFIEIVKGLEAGERVVLGSDQAGIGPGTRVTIDHASQAGRDS